MSTALPWWWQAFHVLPSIGAGGTALLVLAFQVPVLVGTWRRPVPRAFAPAAAYCGIVAFLFGYHVHEKVTTPFLTSLADSAKP